MEGYYGEEKFERFCEWFALQKRSLFPKDFLEVVFTGYIYEDGMCIPKEFDIIDFRVGLYAFAIDIIIDVLEVMRYTGEEELDECEFAYHSCDRRN